MSLTLLTIRAITEAQWGLKKTTDYLAAVDGHGIQTLRKMRIIATEFVSEISAIFNGDHGNKKIAIGKIEDFQFMAYAVNEAKFYYLQAKGQITATPVHPTGSAADDKTIEFPGVSNGTVNSLCGWFLTELFRERLIRTPDANIIHVLYSFANESTVTNSPTHSTTFSGIRVDDMEYTVEISLWCFQLLEMTAEKRAVLEKHGCILPTHEQIISKNRPLAQPLAEKCDNQQTNNSHDC